MDDIYCDQIIPGKLKVEVEYKSDTVLAFRHTNPLHEFHIVIIPKEHVFDITDLEGKSELTVEIIKVANDLINKYELQEKGAILRTGIGNMRNTPHLHFHLLSGERMR